VGLYLQADNNCCSQLVWLPRFEADHGGASDYSLGSSIYTQEGAWNGYTGGKIVKVLMSENNSLLKLYKVSKVFSRGT